jgi:hypothetical protein
MRKPLAILQATVTVSPDVAGLEGGEVADLSTKRSAKMVLVLTYLLRL